MGDTCTCVVAPADSHCLLPPQTRDSIFQRDLGQRAALRKVEGAADRFDSASFYNEFLRSSLSKAEQRLAQDEKLETARHRRDRARHLKEAHSRAVNARHAEKSRRALQSRSAEEQAWGEKSFELRKSNQENVMLRKVLLGGMSPPAPWRILTTILLAPDIPGPAVQDSGVEERPGAGGLRARFVVCWCRCSLSTSVQSKARIQAIRANANWQAEVRCVVSDCIGYL